MSENKDIIACRHCGEELDKNKNNYKREDTPSQWAFHLDWYYCNKCYCYFSTYNGKDSYAIRFDKESLDFFSRGHYSPMKKYRKQILQSIIANIEDEIEYVHEKDTYEDNFHFGAGVRHVTSGHYSPFHIRYDCVFGEDKSGVVSVMWVAISGHNDVYNRMEEKAKLLTYNFEEFDKIKKDRLSRITWERIASIMDLTGAELQMILKNKTKTKLNISQLGCLMRFFNIDKIGDIKEIDTQLLKSYWM